jgi:DNA-binding transcriptional LysR family regulator
MRPQELNLLVIFDTIMTEKSVSRAAEQLSMTQPAVSNAVAKMRVLWKDELFFKSGRNIKPTTYAINLWSQIKDSLFGLNRAIKPDIFDPAIAKRTFKIAVSSLIIDLIWGDLILLMEKEAPLIDLHAIPYTIINTEKMLEDADVDLVIGASHSNKEHILSRYLYDTDYLCVMRGDHELAKSNLSLEKYAGANHMLVSLSGDIFGPVDKALRQNGYKRRVAITVNNFSSVIPLILQSRLIATIPTSAIYKYAIGEALKITRPPIEVKGNPISMLWHKRQNNDPGLNWLLDNIKKLFSEKWNVIEKEIQIL